MVFSLQTDAFLKDNNNAAQRLLDGMNFMAQSVSELSLGPTKAVTSWLTDQIAPAYWRPNSQILVCCRSPLESRHTPPCLCYFAWYSAGSKREAQTFPPPRVSSRSLGRVQL